MSEDADTRRARRMRSLGNTLLGLSITYLASVGTWIYVRKNRIIWYVHDTRNTPKEDVMWSLNYFPKPYRHLVYVETDEKRYATVMDNVYHSEQVWNNSTALQMRRRAVWSRNLPRGDKEGWHAPGP